MAKKSKIPADVRAALNLTKNLVLTGYGPSFFETDRRGATPLATNAPITDLDRPRIHDKWGWDVLYRVSDLSTMKAEFEALGIDPTTSFISIAQKDWVLYWWVPAEADADVLRIDWAHRHNVTVEHAKEYLDSRFVGDDQRGLYRAILNSAAVNA